MSRPSCPPEINRHGKGSTQATDNLATVPVIRSTRERSLSSIAGSQGQHAQSRAESEGTNQTTKTMTKELMKLYAKCRASKPFMLVGSDAKCSLQTARTILAFRQAEADGLVRMRMEPENENYFDVYGCEDDPKHQKEMEDIIERLGCWWTCSEFFDGDEWQEADSCGMHTGYRDPLDPFQNCYVVDEMRAALDALEQHQTEDRETELAIAWP